MKTIAFPGLGIESFNLNSVAFTIPVFGGISIRWYGIIITIGIILAFLYCTYRIKQEGVSFDDLLDITLFAVVFGVLGARLYYVLMSLDSYHSFYDVIAIWEGGLAIYGAIIAGGLTVFVICKRKKIPFLKMFDVASPAVMIGQILGRWGNFFNGEAHGCEVFEDSPLYFIRMGLLPNEESRYQMHYFHPTFLYESLWNLIGFVLINVLYKKKKFDGQIFLMYITWYGFGRMLIEGLRTDSLYIGVFRVSQVVGFLCFTIGGVLLIVNLVKARNKRLAAESYAPTYASITNPTGNTEIPTADSVVAENDTEVQSDEQNEQLDAFSKEDIAKRLNETQSSDEE